MSKLVTHFKAQRLEKKLKPGEVARLLGYRNVQKGANRLIRFEERGVIKEDLLIKLAEVLGIDWVEVEQLAEQDRREYATAWEKWADEPVPIVAVIKLLPGVYSQRPLPAGIPTPEAAEAYACGMARDIHKKLCLVLSRRKSVWIDEAGKVYGRTTATPFSGPNAPWMQIKGSRKFVFGENLSTVNILDQPPAKPAENNG